MTTVTPDYDYSLETEYPGEPGPCNLDQDPLEIITQTCIHSIICAFGLIGNVLVIVTYAFYKRTKTMTDVFLFNVALADLLFVVALPLIIYNEQHSWVMGSVACKILRGVYSINLYSGMLLLACISGDRYIAIVMARRSFGNRSNTLIYSHLICSAVWVSALALSLPTVIYAEQFEEENLWTRTVTMTCQLRIHHNDTVKIMKVLVPTLQVAIGFLLPLLVMVSCYSRIICTLLRAQSSQRHKAVRVVFAVVVVFILCHLPYNAALLSHTLDLFKERGCEAEKIKVKALAATRSVAYLHCCLNPILYAFVGVRFRSHFKQILQDLWCLSKRYINSGRSSRGTSDMYVSGHIIQPNSSFTA